MSPEDQYRYHFVPKLLKLKGICNTWIHRNLSMRGKVTLINSLMVSLVQFIQPNTIRTSGGMELNSKTQKLGCKHAILLGASTCGLTQTRSWEIRLYKFAQHSCLKNKSHFAVWSKIYFHMTDLANLVKVPSLKTYGWTNDRERANLVKPLHSVRQTNLELENMAGSWLSQGQWPHAQPWTPFPLLWGNYQPVWCPLLFPTSSDY